MTKRRPTISTKKLVAILAACCGYDEDRAAEYRADDVASLYRELRGDVKARICRVRVSWILRFGLPDACWRHNHDGKPRPRAPYIPAPVAPPPARPVERRGPSLRLQLWR